MWKIPESFVIIITFMGMITAQADQPAPADTVGADFEELKTESGEVFVNVFVKRVESSALVIRHKEGIARVSLFDLSQSIQTKYNFDPVAAMKADLLHSAGELKRRKLLLLERQRREADLEKARAESDLIQLAKADWVPVEATVVEILNGSVVLEARRITLIATQTRSTLGFLKSGPPKKVLEPFTSDLLLLKEVVPSQNSGKLKPGEIWKGYLNPVAEVHPAKLNTGAPQFPVHEGIAQTP